MTKPINWQDAWGYHTENQYVNIYAVDLTTLIRIKNISNGVGYLLSPIVGLIRIIVAAYGLYVTKDVGLVGAKEGRQFFAMEMGRGVLEILCLGIFLSIVDAKVTLNRYHKTAEA